MLKSSLFVATLFLASAVSAQPPSAAVLPCPAGTQYATIRHSMIMPGKWGVFTKAVADHQAWYAQHGNGSTTSIVRVIAARDGAASLSDTEAVTITRYALKEPPPHDAGWDAFLAEYKASSTVKDDMRVCLPGTTR